MRLPCGCDPETDRRCPAAQALRVRRQEAARARDWVRHHALFVAVAAHLAGLAVGAEG